MGRSARLDRIPERPDAVRLDPALLRAAVGCTADLAEIYADHLTAACEMYDILGPVRMAAFLAQVGHESRSFKYTAEVWGPTDDQKRYEGRKDLGNVQIGDGYFFRGRGLIQVTGRANYTQMAETMGLPLLQSPELLEQPRWAALSAAAWWHGHGCNQLADKGDFELLTRRINGGINGLEDRLKRWERAKTALAATQATTPAPAPETRQDDPAPPAEYAPPRPDAEPYTQPEPAMALPAIAAVAIDAIFTHAPKLIDLFKGGSEVAKRNVEATKVLLEVGKAATGAINEQQMIETLERDPQSAAALRKAVEDNYFKLSEVGEKSVAAARDFMVSYSQMKDVRTVAGKLTFIELFSLMMVIAGFGGVGSLIYWNKLAQSTIDNIAMLAVVGTIIAVREFWLGSSAGSRQKDLNPDRAI